MAKQNRKWNIQLIVRVTEKEKDLIQQKMAMLKTENLSAYIRKIAVDGHIINVDHTDVKNHAAQLQRVGGNTNQIAKRMNQTGSLYSSDVAQVKKLLHDIWLSERQLLLKMRIRGMGSPNKLNECFRHKPEYSFYGTGYPFPMSTPQKLNDI